MKDVLKCRIINNKLYLANSKNKFLIENNQITSLCAESYPRLKKDWISLDILIKHAPSKKMTQLIGAIKNRFKESESEFLIRERIGFFVFSENSNIIKIIKRKETIEMCSDLTDVKCKIIYVDECDIYNISAYISNSTREYIFIVNINNNLILTKRILNFSNLLDYKNKVYLNEDMEYAISKAISMCENETDDRNYFYLVHTEEDISVTKRHLLTQIVETDSTELTLSNFSNFNLKQNIDQNKSYQVLRNFQRDHDYWIENLEFMDKVQIPFNVMESTFKYKEKRITSVTVAETPYNSFVEGFMYGLVTNLTLRANHQLSTRWIAARDTVDILKGTYDLIFDKIFYQKLSKVNSYLLDTKEVIDLAGDPFFSNIIMMNSFSSVFENYSFELYKVKNFQFYCFTIYMKNEIVWRHSGINLTNLLRDGLIHIFGAYIQQDLIKSNKRCDLLDKPLNSRSNVNVGFDREVIEECSYIQELADYFNISTNYRSWIYNYLIIGSGIKVIQFNAEVTK